MDIITTSIQEIPATCLLYEWCNISAIRVLHVWNDVEVKRLVITMLDKNREKVLAFVPTNLVPLYSIVDLVGNVFSLNHFTSESLHIHPPMFEHYALCIKDWAIIIHHNTILTRLPDKFVENFPIYPLVSSITSLLQANTNRRMLIDVLGKIIWGVRINKPFLAYHLILLNEMGNIIHLYLNRIPYHRMVSVILAKHHQSIIYVSRVKLVHRPQLNNFLVSTTLSDFDIHPIMPEAQMINESLN
ncbi:hypothetical protein LXL04_027888 [Taraxacum kok-saghyz]